MKINDRCPDRMSMSLSRPLSLPTVAPDALFNRPHSSQTEAGALTEEVAFLICSELASRGWNDLAASVWARMGRGPRTHFASFLPSLPLTSVAHYFLSQTQPQSQQATSLAHQSDCSQPGPRDVLISTSSWAPVPCFRWRPLRYESPRSPGHNCMTSTLRGRRSRLDRLHSRAQSASALASQTFQSWRALKVVQGHLSNVWCAAFSCNGDLVASGSDDYLIKIWCANTCRLLMTLRGHHGELSDLAFGSRAEILASAAVDGTVRVWDIRRNGEPICIFAHAHKANIMKISFISDRWVLTAAQDGKSCAFDVLHPQQPALTVHARVEHLQSHFHPSMRNPTLSPNCVVDDSALPAEADTGGMQNGFYVPQSVMDTDGTAAQPRALKPEFLSVTIAPAPWQEYALSSNDHSIRTFFWPSGELLDVLMAHTHEVNQVMYSPSGLRLLAVDDSGEALVWQRINNTLQGACRWAAVSRVRVLSGSIAPVSENSTMRAQMMKSPSVKIKAAIWYSDESGVVTVDTEWALKVWLIDRNYRADSAPLKMASVAEHRRTRDLDFVAIQFQRNLAKALLAPCVFSSRVHTKDIRVIKLHPIFRHICLTAGEDGVVVLWDLQRYQLLRAWKCHSAARFADGAFSPTGEAVCLTDFEGRVWLFGTSSRLSYTDAPIEQFFSTDFSQITHDINGAVVDTASNMPPHQMHQQLMIAADASVYHPQPQFLACAHTTMPTLSGPGLTLVERDHLILNALSKMKEKRILARYQKGHNSHLQVVAVLDGDLAEPNNCEKSNAQQDSLAACMRAVGWQDDIVEVDSDYDDLLVLDLSELEAQSTMKGGRGRNSRRSNAQEQEAADRSAIEWTEAQKILDEEAATIDIDEHERDDEEYLPHEDISASPSRRSQHESTTSTPTSSNGAHRRQKANHARNGARSSARQEFLIDDSEKDESMLMSSSSEESSADDSEYDDAFGDDTKDPRVRRVATRRARPFSELTEEEFSPKRKSKKRRRDRPVKRRVNKQKVFDDEDEGLQHHLSSEEDEPLAATDLTAPASPMDNAMPLARQWLHSSTQVYGRYVPQVGDKVYYFKAGHAAVMHSSTPIGVHEKSLISPHLNGVDAKNHHVELLTASSSPSAKVGPHVIDDSMFGEMNAPDAFECIVTDIKYTFERNLHLPHALESAETMLAEEQSTVVQNESEIEDSVEPMKDTHLQETCFRMSTRSRSQHTHVDPPTSHSFEDDIRNNESLSSHAHSNTVSLKTDHSMRSSIYYSKTRSRSFSSSSKRVTEASLISSMSLARAEVAGADGPMSPTWIAPYFFSSESETKHSLVKNSFSDDRVACRLTLKPCLEAQSLTCSRKAERSNPEQRAADTRTSKVSRRANNLITIRLRTESQPDERLWTFDNIILDWIDLSGADWLVLSSRVHSCLEHEWKDNDQFRMFYHDELKFYVGRIVLNNQTSLRRQSLRKTCGSRKKSEQSLLRNSARVPLILSNEDSTRCNKASNAWESLCIRWEQLNSRNVEYVSPWEIEHPLINEPIGTAISKLQAPTAPFLFPSLHDHLLTLVKRCRADEQFALLNFPVDSNLYPLYLKLISYPICLAWLEQRLLAGYYRSLPSFLHDVRQIRIAAIEFNERETPVVERATELVKLIFQSCLQWLEDSSETKDSALVEYVMDQRALLHLYQPWNRFVNQLAKLRFLC